MGISGERRKIRFQIQKYPYTTRKIPLTLDRYDIHKLRENDVNNMFITCLATIVFHIYIFIYTYHNMFRPLWAIIR
jgi:hypothetical protein